MSYEHLSREELLALLAQRERDLDQQLVQSVKWMKRCEAAEAELRRRMTPTPEARTGVWGDV